MDSILDRPTEFCGIVGIYGDENASFSSYLSLHALQHRGQESAGIAVSDGQTVRKHLGMGLVSDVFSEQDLQKLKGHIAIGHNRYSTTGASAELNIQPIVVRYKDGELGIGHNGNLTNSQTLRRKLEARGSIFQTTSDSEVILHLVAKSLEESLIDSIKDAVRQIEGAFSLVFLTRDKLIVVRDPYGFRPLALGKMGNSYVVASETTAFDLLGAEYIRDVEKGEMIVFDEQGMHVFHPFPRCEAAHCVFEFVYFSRPDSRIFGEYVDKTRRKLGKNLALENDVEADIVISVPDSSNTTALGFSARSSLKYEIGLIRNHYIGRTFIKPTQKTRASSVKLKFNTVGGVLKDRRVVIVDDSIVRGTTLKKLVQTIREAGAREVHLRISSPPIKNPCFYGMNFPTHEELIANQRSVDEICEYLGADSLKYLSIKGMIDSMPADQGQGYCTACFSGIYPLKVKDLEEK
ncbi:MAG TPA: amidophosphoribosyltransferase [Caldithrix abyssi]|uniref:Amidophosphoribosyltransferase n=1 Tax=Caldithrix abyssi TaxID=187145 RepID=A0A7V1LJJ3_CALAY|nr:amidophosphoribosyltransferase [Caldithrix abyssi]